MNEASSKFVDNIAVEKLLNEKLKKVSHSFDNSLFIDGKITFDDLREKEIDKENIIIEKMNKLKYYKIPSFLAGNHYNENNYIYLYEHPADYPAANILFLHGLYDDNLQNYDFLIRLLNEMNFNVYFMILPFHFERKPAGSYFSGEYFLSADLYRSKAAYRQAIYDIEASLQFVNYLDKLPVMLIGFSMGASITLRYYTLRNSVKKLFLINPVTNLLNLVWDNTLLVTVREDIKRAGLPASITNVIFHDLDPCLNLPANLDRDSIAIAFSKYDQIITEEKYQTFIERTGVKNLYPYYAGHLNVLRVPVLSRDIMNFYQYKR